MISRLAVLVISLVSFSGAADPFWVTQRAYYLDGLRQLGWTGFETPIVVHIAHGLTVPIQLCIAYYSENALNILTLARPIIETPPAMHTSDAILQCQAYALAISGNFFFAPLSEPNGEQKVIDVLDPLFQALGYQDMTFSVDEDVLNCNKDVECLRNVADLQNYSPKIMASIISEQVIDEFEKDGWNMYGLKTSCGDVCEANCRPYSDWTGYVPQNNPWVKNENKNKNSKYWQPLLESDGAGFFYRHEHVTPHIGIKGKKYLLQKYEKADDPKYNYKKEAELVLSRLKTLAVSDYQKVAVEYFDSKLNLRGLLFDHLYATYGDAFTNEMFTVFTTGISFAEHEAVLQAWNQKVYYDRIRPTTVIQSWGDQEIETYAGPFEGIQTFKAKYFEPYIRVMPHSEYPSGSACICTAYKEFTDLFVYEYYGDESLFNMSVTIPAGSSQIELGVTPQEDVTIRLQDMSELADICGESRLWGGMHFTKSVDEANRICSGIGQKAFDLIQEAFGEVEWSSYSSSKAAEYVENDNGFKISLGDLESKPRQEPAENPWPVDNMLNSINIVLVIALTVAFTLFVAIGVCIGIKIGKYKQYQVKWMESQKINH